MSSLFMIKKKMNVICLTLYGAVRLKFSSSRTHKMEMSGAACLLLSYKIYYVMLNLLCIIFTVFCTYAIPVLEYDIIV